MYKIAKDYNLQIPSQKINESKDNKSINTNTIVNKIKTERVNDFSFLEWLCMKQGWNIYGQKYGTIQVHKWYSI